MAEQKMVKVNLRNSVGLRNGPLYGPGEGVEVPQELADALGLKEQDLSTEEVVQPPAPLSPARRELKDLHMDELRALADANGVTVAPGRNRDEPNEADFRKALREAGITEVAEPDPNA